jgi:hypothetical protein
MLFEQNLNGGTLFLGFITFIAFFIFKFFNSPWEGRVSYVIPHSTPLHPLCASIVSILGKWDLNECVGVSASRIIIDYIHYLENILLLLCFAYTIIAKIDLYQIRSR